MQRLKAEAAQLREEVEMMREAKAVLRGQQEAVILAQLKGGLARMQGAADELEHHKAAVRAYNHLENLSNTVFSRVDGRTEMSSTIPVHLLLIHSSLSPQPFNPCQN